MNKLEKKYVNAAFIVAFIILVSINIVTYFNIRLHFDDEEVINEVLAEIQLSESLQSKINEAETSRRGYFITGESIFLNQYNSAARSVDSIFLRLSGAVTNEKKNLVDSLGKAIFIRKDILEESIELQDLKKRDIKRQIDYTNLGREYQDKIKLLIERLQSLERENVGLRLKQADKSASYTLINLIAGSIIAYLLLIAAVFILNKNITRRRQTENKLWESRNWFATTLQSIGDGVIVTSKVGDVVYMNKVAEQITEWKENEVRGLMIDHIFDLYSKRTGEKVRVLNNISSKYDFGSAASNDVVLKTKQGTKIPVEFNGSNLAQDSDKNMGTVYVFRDISERIKAENELLDSKKFIQRIADSIPSVIYTYSLNELKLDYVNYKIIDLLGYSSQYVINLGTDFFTKLIHPDDVERLLGLMKKNMFVKDSEIIDYEYRILNSKGEWRWFKSYDVVFIRGKDGLVQEMLGTAMDVTSEKKLEEEIKKYSGHLEELVEIRTKELRRANEKLYREIQERAKAENNIIEAEEKFRSLVEFTMVGIYIIQDNKFIYVNPKFEEIFGYERNELTGTDILSRVYTEDLEIVFGNIRKRLTNEVETVHYEFRGLRKDGSLIDVEVRGTKMLYKKKFAIIGTLLDITERKRFEKAILEQQQFLDTVININPSFIFAKDYEGKFTIVNKAVADNYGTTIENLIGKSDADFNNSEEEVDRFGKDDREVITSQVPKFIPEEYVTNSATGETKWYQTTKIPLVTKTGEVQVLGVSTDITSRKLAEELTKKSLQEKELLLKEIHHRVKNNLQIIVSLLKLQAKYLHDKRDVELFINSRSRVETMSMMHEKLYKTQDLSNIDLGNYLSDLINNMIKTSVPGKEDYSFGINNDRVLTSIDNAIPCGLIINELLLFMMKYSLDGTKHKSISLNLNRMDGKILVKIADNGKGIKQAQAASSADSLGFQLIDMLVKQLDGQVRIKNNSGTSFELIFKEITYKERI